MDSIVPSNTSNNPQLIVDYHETQFLEQLNKENHQRIENPQEKSQSNSINSQAFDRYAYVNNNPIRYNDPTGHKNCEEDGYNCSDDKPPFDYHLGGDNDTANSQEKTLSDNPNYKEAIAGAAILFVTEAVGVSLSLAAGIGTAPAGPEVAIPAFFTVYVAYHEQTAPIFSIGFFMIYDGLQK